MKMIIEPYIVKFEQKGVAEEGYLSIVDSINNNFFEIKRIYWTYNTPTEVERGKHAHKKSVQILVAIVGVINVSLIGANFESIDFTLSHPNEGLVIPPNYWHTMKYSKGAVQLILSSTKFSEEDYIRDFDEFISYWKEK